jgi:chaperonin GroES
MKLVPVDDKVAVKRIQKDKATASGIVLPDTNKEKPTKGEVVAVGPGKYDRKGNLHPAPVKVGDFIVFPLYQGTELKLDGEELLILEPSQILGVLPNG